MIDALGGHVEKPKNGSHWKAYRSDGRMYPLPSHNGPKGELPDEYLRGLARHFGISNEELMRRLRGG